MLSYLYFIGPTGCGKTTAGETIVALCYNPLNMASATVAYLIRRIKDDPHTILLDEAQQYLKNNERGKFMAIVNACYKRGMKAGLTKQGKDDWEPVDYDVFSPLIFTSTENTIPTLQRRCIYIEMTRNIKPIHVVKDKTTIPQLRRKLTKFRHDFLHEFSALPFNDIEDKFRKGGCNDNTVIERLINLYAVMPPEPQQRLLIYAKEQADDAQDTEQNAYYTKIFNVIYALWQADASQAKTKKIGVSAICDAYHTAYKEVVEPIKMGIDLNRLGYTHHTSVAGNKAGRKIKEPFLRRQLKRWRPGERGYSDSPERTGQQQLPNTQKNVNEGEMESWERGGREAQTPPPPSSIRGLLSPDSPDSPNPLLSRL